MGKRDERIIILFECKQNWKAMITNIIFIVLIGFLTGKFIDALQFDKEQSHLFFTDLLLFVALPFCNHSYYHYVTGQLTDHNWRRNIFYRMLPIPTLTIIRAKIMLHWGTLIVVLVLFFASVSIFSRHLLDYLTMLQYVRFSLLWISYIFILNMIIIYLEQTLNRKRFFWITSLVIPLCLLVVLILTHYVFPLKSLTYSSLLFAANYTVISLAIPSLVVFLLLYLKAKMSVFILKKDVPIL